MITIIGTSKGGSTRFTFETEDELDAILDAFRLRYPTVADPIVEFAPQAKRRTTVLKHKRLYLSGGANYYRQALDGRSISSTNQLRNEKLNRVLTALDGGNR